MAGGQAGPRRRRRGGFLLVEVLISGMVLAVAMAALMGAYVSQMTLNEHSRNLSSAIHDANRVLERIRQDQVGCETPDIRPPTGTSWDAWLTAKSVTDVVGEEVIVVTCVTSGLAGTPDPATEYCGNDGAGAFEDQVGSGEWQVDAEPADPFDPLQVTVAVCWRHRSRTIGECAWNDEALSADDADGDGVITSPAMLTTLVTCRST